MENYGSFISDHDTVYFQVSKDGNSIYYAEQMRDDYPSWGDLCSGTAVIDVSAGELTGEDVSIDPEHAPDMAALNAAQRTLDSYQGGDSYERYIYDRELWEISAKVAKRAGVGIYGVSHYHYATTVTNRLEHAEYLCFINRPVDDGGDYHGREFCAAANGYRWSVYRCNMSRLQAWITDGWGDHTDFDYRGESVEDCHGYTWQNIGYDGDSFPTKGELLDTI